MRKLFFIPILSIIVSPVFAQNNWRIAGDNIKTQWAIDVQPSNVLPEYPRPQMERSGTWINLNGLWQYSILPVEDGKDLSAAVYTRSTDVEGEINGLMTYDRKVMKMPIDELKKANSKLQNKIKNF